MHGLEPDIRSLAETKQFSGVVRVDRCGDLEYVGAFGLAERGLGVANDVHTQLGLGDYLDEDAGVELTDYLMPVPVQELATTEEYLQVLAGHPQKFPPGERFSYCNSG